MKISILFHYVFIHVFWIFSYSLFYNDKTTELINPCVKKYRIFTCNQQYYLKLNISFRFSIEQFKANLKMLNYLMNIKILGMNLFYVIILLLLYAFHIVFLISFCLPQNIISLSIIFKDLKKILVWWLSFYIIKYFCFVVCSTGENGCFPHFEQNYFAEYVKKMRRKW